MQIWQQRDERCVADDYDSELILALERQEFLLHYQPVIDLKTGKIVGAEAFLRWNHPRRGLLVAREFLSGVKQTNTLFSIQEWAIQRVCMQNKKWQESGISPFPVSVNLSLLSLIHDDLVTVVERALEASGLESRWLELELTEDMAFDAEQALEILLQLKRIGVTISIDDFGRGYSSLSQLKRYPIDKLKIDQSFVQDQAEEMVVTAIIGMAKSLRLQVVAEGVESKEQLHFLQKHMCDAAQGFFIARPVAAHELLMNMALAQEIVDKHGNGLRSNEAAHEPWRAIHTRCELGNLLKNQQGMIFTFRKIGDKFIHTLCEGELMHRAGLMSEQVVGKELKEFLPALEAERKTRYYERAWSGEENINYEGLTNEVYYLAALRPIFQNGAVKEVIASCVDITDLKRAEAKMRESEAKYRVIAENVSDMIVVLDQRGMVTYTSPSVSSILGISPEEVHDKHMLTFILPDEKERVLKHVEEMIKWKLPQQLVFSGKHRNGSKLILEAKGSPVFDCQGGVQQMIFLIRNITAQVHAEEFLRKIDKLAAVGQLAAGVAHEIRNPVTSIKGFVQLLKQDRGKKEYFDIILAEFQQLENTLREFVLLSGQRSLLEEQVELCTILVSVVGQLQETTVLHDLRLDLVEGESSKIRCNPGQIRQLFLNLLTNAMDAMPGGGTIQVGMFNEGSDKVKIRIVDEGCGMSQDRLNRLGEPFYSTKEKGIGLGLMVSYKIIEYHQGYVHFSSDPQKGTTVEVVFPIEKVRSVT
ncbi:EAL domain-containing protein [Brevibacillus centrosporus]|uniref:EAL domain-containing protein n=1 Tax=Brevibacillus centrosporus TaxID=54910 RepID=UPI003B015E00